ncbi:hypothetical protein ABET52_05995 [Saccharococcus caldoxylosilyticus]|uniref:hypothetical protein n=1 Tax=Saccharococcus caldoxylosilyticus TaxID=81408 RepID=UPI003D33F215
MGNYLHHKGIAAKNQMEVEKVARTITIPFSPDKFDQWRLSKVGGQISFNKAGRPVFQFENAQQYHKYLELNAQRQNFMKGEVR